MRITYIANIKIPSERAHGVQIMKMCESFSEQDYCVELVVPRMLESFKEDPFEYYGLRKSFKITRLPTVDLSGFGKTGYLIQLVIFTVFSTIYSLVKKQEIIYSRDELPLFFINIFKKNTVWELHMPRDNFVSNILLGRIKKIVAISQGLKNFCLKRGADSQKVFVAHDGVDLKDFIIDVDKDKVRDNLGLSKTKKIVMYIGGLEPWKGVRTLLEASTHLDNAQVVVIGGGLELKKFKRDYPNVIFKGFLPYRELPYNQKAADVLVVPNSGKSSISSFYTSPLKVFAHMSSGVPIVVSDLPVLREVLGTNNSVLFEHDNPRSLAVSIREVLDNKDLRDRITRQALIDVKKYSWSTRAKQIIKFIQNA